MKIKVLLIFSIYFLIFILGGVAYSQLILEGSLLNNILIGGFIIFQLVTIYFVLSSLTLFVFTSIVFRSISEHWKIRLGKSSYAVTLSYSPLIVLFLTLIISQYFNLRNIGITDFLHYITFTLKGITPIVLFFTFWKAYKIDFFKSCLTVSTYFILLTVISKVPSLI